MRKCSFFLLVLVILAFQLALLTGAQADVVGRLTQVEDWVDILRGGQLPATPVKVDDRVQTGDVLRTKSLSKAQITFIDNFILTIAPESRVGIEAYMFDSTQNKRNAVVQLFQGLAHVVVNKVFKSAEPDFVVKTQTAIMGVRGTEFGIRLQPNSSDILNFKGLLQVGNIFPEVGQLPQRAFQAATSSGSKGGVKHDHVYQHNQTDIDFLYRRGFTKGAGAFNPLVFLKEMQVTSAGRGLPPTLPFTITSEDRQMFMNQMATGLLGRKQGQGTGLGTPVAGSGVTSPSVPHIAPTGLISGNSQGVVWGIYTPKMLNAVTVPPKVVSQVQAPPPAPVQPPPTSVDSSWGEGVLNFARAFQQAGSRSVMVALLNIPVEESLKFYHSFYQA